MVPLGQCFLVTRAFNLQALSILPIGNFSAKDHCQFVLQIVIQIMCFDMTNIKITLKVLSQCRRHMDVVGYLIICLV